MLAKALLIWIGLLVVAVLNGGVRNAVLAPRFGELAGHVISTGILCGVILSVAWLTIPWLGPRGAHQALLIGTVWMVLTVAFEFLGGHYLFGHSWQRLLADYDLLRGRVWILVPLASLLAPLWAFSRRGERDGGSQVSGQRR